MADFWHTGERMSARGDISRRTMGRAFRRGLGVAADDSDELDPKMVVTGDFTVFVGFSSS
jgi:hypothetical protein